MRLGFSFPERCVFFSSLHKSHCHLRQRHQQHLDLFSFTNNWPCCQRGRVAAKGKGCPGSPFRPRLFACPDPVGTVMPWRLIASCKLPTGHRPACMRWASYTYINGVGRGTTARFNRLTALSVVQPLALSKEKGRSDPYGSCPGFWGFHLMFMCVNGSCI